VLGEFGVIRRRQAEIDGRRGELESAVVVDHAMAS
jgi:hypothetical protein